MALVTSSLVSRTATSSSTGISQARMAARTWPRASPAAAGLAVSRTRQTCSSVGRVSAIAFIGILIGRGAGLCAEMLGTSCKKIVVELALQDIGQLTDFGSTALRASATTVPGALADRSGAGQAGQVSRSVADDGDHGPCAQVDTVAV